jgi:DNA modification methylase
VSVHYEDDRVTLHHGDCLDVLRSLPDSSVDSVVCDPPYGLSNTDPAHVADTVVRWVNGERDYLPPVKGGFMGKEWDSFVPPVAVWDECYRVLKPGGHVLAFAGSRTHDLMTLGIRLAGFDIRDSIAWLYAQGFPKSMNPGRDQRFCQGCEVESDHADGTQTATEHGLSGVLLGDVSQAEGSPRGAGPVLLPSVPQQGAPAAGRAEPAHDVRGEQPSLEGRGDLQAAEGQLLGAALREVPGGPAVHGEVGRLRDGAPASDGSSDRATAAEVGSGEPHQPRPTGQPTGEPGAVPEQRGSQAGRGGQVCAGCGKPPAPVGLGTALKPSFEPIVCARKPLSGTVAQTVLAHGTDAADLATSQAKNPGRSDTVTSGVYGADRPQQRVNTSGRWPTNVVLDESQAAELDRQSGESRDGVAVKRNRPEEGRSAYEASSYMITDRSREDHGYGGAGGASRFFPTFRYEAKAPKSERPRYKREGGSDNATTYGQMKTRECNVCGSRANSTGGKHSGKPWPTCGHGDWSWVEQQSARDEYVAHPTVKPLDLMRWLVRLVTPPGGTVLEPFAGSGTTVEACLIEGFRCVAIEREADYLPLITQRIHRRRDPIEAVRQTGGDLGLFDLEEGA